MHIFGDEAGFTGNKLLDSEQEIFAYSTVAFEPAEANELVSKIKRSFRMQGPELKGKNLVSRPRGRQVVTQILKECRGRYRVAAHLKPYALGCKLFEYIFEPPMSDFNSFLYSIDFHKFIGTLLFIYFRSKNKSAELVLEEFTKFAHRRDEVALKRIFPKSTYGYREDPMEAIGTFAFVHRDCIKDEILSYREPGVPNWILDLTTTSLHGLLCWWGERAKQLEVTCDDSKPIAGDIRMFNSMVNRRNKAYVKFQGKKRAFTFNLSTELRLAKSHENPGLQLADVIASAAAFAMRAKYRHEKVAASTSTWIDELLQHMGDDNIWPDYDDADLSQPKCFANTLLLLELVRRSLDGEDLFDGLPQIFLAAQSLHPAFMEAKS